MIDYGLATSDRWKQLLSDVSKDSMITLDDAYYRIVTMYNNIDRHYHNLNHISNCLAEFDSVKKSEFDEPDYPMETELALWYHDFIYFSTLTDNEEKSSLVANGYLWALGLDLEQRARVTNMILATRHNAIETIHDCQLVCDIDLAILGKPEMIFDEYEANIKKEYDMLPDEVFNKQRIKILQKFLDKDMIYYTGFFREKYESTARRNIIKSIKRLHELDGMK